MNDTEKPKLNVERIREVANTIEANSDKFNMETYFSDCGTPSCIAGWVVKKTPHPLEDDILAEAQEALGLTDDQAVDLFMPTFPSANYEAKRGTPGHITSEHAVDVLFELADSGKVDWSRFTRLKQFRKRYGFDTSKIADWPEELQPDTNPELPRGTENE